VAAILIRLVAVVFAIIQASLLLRLVLPFVDQVPRVLRPFVPTLIAFTDLLIAPFAGLVEPFELSDVTDVPDVLTDVLQSYVDQVDQAVIVAMIGWAIIGAVVLFVLRAVIRPR
jgi:hypothetical protein